MIKPPDNASSLDQQSDPQAGFWQFIRRGILRRCPYCGCGKLFRSYISLHPFCSHCGGRFQDLHADDAPPYITILIVGHIVVPLLLTWEQIAPAPVWFMAGVIALLTLTLSLILLPFVKGGVVGVLAKLRSRGEQLPDQ